MHTQPELLVGHVMHRRLRPVPHTFVHPVFFVRLPLEHLDAADNAVFGVDRLRLMSFLRRDHGARDGSPLRPWIAARLRERGLPDDGPVVLQTFPRVLGYVFNPVSFWFCHNRDGQPIAVLAEVNNTFGGTHAYLLHHPDGRPLQDGETLSADKAFHVSPFCKVDGGYRFRFRCATTSGRHVACIDHDDSNGPLLRTAISGRVHAWTPSALLAALLRMPLLTFGIMARIHWHALRLWLKGVPFVGARSPSPAHEDPIA